MYTTTIHTLYTLGGCCGAALICYVISFVAKGKAGEFFGRATGFFFGGIIVTALCLVFLLLSAIKPVT